MQVKARDFFRERLTADELRDILGEAPPPEAITWRSPRAKALGLDPANPPPPQELLRLVLEVPHLLRRPVIRLGGRTIFGFDRRALEEALTQGGK
ncbi:MAG TPA: ArsC/Spx/MgsR family protein [Dehalococcoidia bacterium]|nr:ArsC/Spx/MgsR family protein [Dehalococcoidia bacterium]